MAIYNNSNSTRRSISDILKSAKSDFLYLFETERYSRDEIIQLIEGLNAMHKSLKCFVNRPKALGNVPGNLFYIDNIEDLEIAEQFGKQNNSHILSFQIVHNPKRDWDSVSVP